MRVPRRVRVRAPQSNAGRRGTHYVATQDVTPDEAPLQLNRRTTGTIEPPFNGDRWTTSLRAGQQVRFDLRNTTGPRLRFTLEGPGGDKLFDAIDDDPR